MQYVHITVANDSSEENNPIWRQFPASQLTASDGRVSF